MINLNIKNMIFKVPLLLLPLLLLLGRGSAATVRARLVEVGIVLEVVRVIALTRLQIHQRNSP